MPVTGSTHPAIRATDLSFSRDNDDILHDFSFEIPDGAYVGIIGPNGGGKTTLVRLLTGLLTPTGGHIEIFGHHPDDPAVRHDLGYVAQRGVLDLQFPATVEEVVRAGRTPRLGLFGRFQKKDDRAVTHALKAMGIDALRHRPISRLSGGERQKVMIARALAGEPRILFLDEPVDGLDPNARDAFYKLLRGLNKDGLTILFVSHDVHAVAQEADSAICLKHQLVCHGTKACVIGKGELRDLIHSSRSEILHHHDV